MNLLTSSLVNELIFLSPVAGHISWGMSRLSNDVSGFRHSRACFINSMLFIDMTLTWFSFSLIHSRIFALKVFSLLWRSMVVFGVILYFSRHWCTPVRFKLSLSSQAFWYCVNWQMLFSILYRRSAVARVFFCPVNMRMLGCGTESLTYFSIVMFS